MLRQPGKKRAKNEKRASTANQTPQESPLTPHAEANANNIQVKEDIAAEKPEKPGEKASPLEAAVAKGACGKLPRQT